MFRFRFLLPVASLSFLFACAGVDGVAMDTDEDGLADSWEAEIGLDPESADSDGDGWSDYDELWGHADPLDEDDHPYTGGWERNPVPSDLDEEETGWEVGDLMPGFTALDQFGDAVSTRSFFGNVLLIKNSAVWCGPCRSSEEEAEGRYQNFREQGFLQLTLIGEDQGGQPPSQQVLEEWAAMPAEAVTFPVLDDGNWENGNNLERDGGIPTFSLVGRDGTLRVVDGGHSDSQIQALLDEEAPEVDWEPPPALDEVTGGGAAPVSSSAAPFSGGTSGDEAIVSSSPYGGAACSASGSAGGTWLAAALALFGVSGTLRRRS